MQNQNKDTKMGEGATKFKKKKLKTNKKRKRIDVNDADINDTFKNNDNVNEENTKNNEKNTNNDTTNDEIIDIDKKLEDTKFLIKKIRRNKHGLKFEENEQYTESGLESNAEKFQHNPTKQFGQNFATETVQEDIEKQRKKEWVDRQMIEKLKNEGRILPGDLKKNDSIDNDNDNDKTIVKNTVKTLKEELYELPTHLNRKFTHLPDTEPGERWVGGMEEVELPIEVKLKNMKETEEAKQKLLFPKIKHQRVFEIPKNYNQNFQSHSYDYAKSQEMKRKQFENITKLNLQKQREIKKRKVINTDQWLLNTDNVISMRQTNNNDTTNDNNDNTNNNTIAKNMPNLE